MSDDVIIEELDSSDIPEGELSEFKIVDTSAIVPGTSGLFSSVIQDEDEDFDFDLGDDENTNDSGEEMSPSKKGRMWLSNLLKGNIPKVIKTL